MKQKRVLAILGSPRKDGVIAAMLERSIQAARRAGHTVTRIDLYEKHLAFCAGCRACLDTGTCIQKDDIQEIVSLLQESQIVVLAAPTYWANVPAPVKNLFDRLLGAAMEETATFPKPRLSGRGYMLLTACNTPWPFSWLFGQSRGAIRNMDEFFKTAGMRPMEKVVCANTGKQKTVSVRVLRKIERCWK